MYHKPGHNSNTKIYFERHIRRVSVIYKKKKRILKYICISISTGDKQHTSPLDVVPRHVAHCAIKTCCAGREASSNRILHTCSKIKFVYNMYIIRASCNKISPNVKQHPHSTRYAHDGLGPSHGNPFLSIQPLRHLQNQQGVLPRKALHIYIYIVLSIYIYTYYVYNKSIWYKDWYKEQNTNNKHQQTISCDVWGAITWPRCRNMEVASQL